MTGRSLYITLKRSGIGCTPRQRETLRGLGLRRRGRTVIHKDSLAVRGMIAKVHHLIEVQEHGSKSA